MLNICESYAFVSWKLEMEGQVSMGYAPAPYFRENYCFRLLGKWVRRMPTVASCVAGRQLVPGCLLGRVNSWVRVAVTQRV